MQVFWALFNLICTLFVYSFTYAFFRGPSANPPARIQARNPPRALLRPSRPFPGFHIEGDPPQSMQPSLLDRPKIVDGSMSITSPSRSSFERRMPMEA